MPKFRIQVADKETGDEHVFDRYAASEEEARRKAIDAGWLLMSCNPLPDDERSKPKGSLWTPTDPAERAVVRGMVKGYIIIVAINIGIGAVVGLFLAIANSQ